ncbi:MAG: hypothetical protein ABIL09_30080 [Gemmatimonadota bacterium]
MGRFAQTALLLAVSLGVYANSLDGTFHYDDLHSIVENPHLRSLAQAGRFFTGTEAFSSDPGKGMYRPVLLVTYALNYRFGGYEVAGYHALNMALHAACVLLVWALAGQAGLGGGRALVAALLFAAHPLGTEPVNYISSRSEVLAAGFYLAALLLYLHPGRAARVASLACFALGLLTKSVVATLPAALWLLDGVGRGRGALRRHLPYWSLAGLYAGLLVAVGFAESSLAKSPRALDAQLWTQLKAVPYYLKLVAVPVGLSVEHQFQVSLVPDAPVLLAAALVLSAVAVGRCCWRGADRFWLLFPALAALPAAVVPLNVLVNEHRLYLPLAGLCVLVVRLLPERHPGLGLRLAGVGGPGRPGRPGRGAQRRVGRRAGPVVGRGAEGPDDEPGPRPPGQCPAGRRAGAGGHGRLPGRGGAGFARSRGAHQPGQPALRAGRLGQQGRGRS